MTFNLAGSSVRPRFELPEDLWSLKADKGQIGQVLANLAINAKEAMPGGGQLFVEGTNISDGGHDCGIDLCDACVRLTIRDEGTGIPSQIIDRIFDPYYSTKQAGHGLGLAVVHSIVTRHGGHISVESVSDVGTTFTIFLPAAPSAAAKVEKDAFPTTEERDRMSLHILVMDDERLLREVASRMLESCGHSVDAASDGVQALDMYAAAMKNERHYDLVVMDLTIPGGMGGVDAMERLMEMDPRARVIVSSGYSSDPVLADFGAYGFSGRLAKPFRMAELKTEVGRVMELA